MLEKELEAVRCLLVDAQVTSICDSYQRAPGGDCSNSCLQLFWSRGVCKGYVAELMRRVYHVELP